MKLIKHTEIPRELIKGITYCQGSKRALAFLTNDDILGLAKMLVGREEEFRGELFSAILSPVNDFRSAKAMVQAKTCSKVVTKKTLFFSKAVKEPKRIYLVPVPNKLYVGKEADHLTPLKKQLVKDGLHYLFPMIKHLRQIVEQSGNFPFNHVVQISAGLSDQFKHEFSGKKKVLLSIVFDTNTIWINTCIRAMTLPNFYQSGSYLLAENLAG
jgi:hypothetical protein